MTNNYMKKMVLGRFINGSVCRCTISPTNSNSSECQYCELELAFDKMPCRWNDMLMKWLVDKMPYRWNDTLMKWLVDKMPCQRTYTLMKWHHIKAITCQWNEMSTKWHVDKMTRRQNDTSMKWPGTSELWQMSRKIKF